MQTSSFFPIGKRVPVNSLVLRRWLRRETLWNEVEASKNLKALSFARYIEISFTRELGRAEAIRLARNFVREQFVD